MSASCLLKVSAHMMGHIMKVLTFMYTPSQLMGICKQSSTAPTSRALMPSGCAMHAWFRPYKMSQNLTQLTMSPSTNHDNPGLMTVNGTQKHFCIIPRVSMTNFFGIYSNRTPRRLEIRHVSFGVSMVELSYAKSHQCDSLHLFPMNGCT